MQFFRFHLDPEKFVKHEVILPILVEFEKCTINLWYFCYIVGVYSDTDGGQLVFLLQGQQGGVTHVLFSPDGTKLYSGGRKVK